MVCSIKGILTFSALLGLNVAGQQISAADATTQEQQIAPPGSGGNAEDGTPSLEFLEFIGLWETDEGEWIAPSDLAEDSFVDLIGVDFDDSAGQTEPDSNDIN
ncbi:MAG: hypothetical protein Q8L60_08770 [Gammaproteobacteria bacterium]|nr:hypothetical protein [Gammaproteobacteria bacterium]MDP2140265.1 hypothetical protein [Gammaproteobacteria bacterium]MDP2348140.1 hypothetical protein [Gammaproteobacteria bacterium]